MIYVRKVIDGAMNYVYANGSAPLSLSRIGGASKTPCITQIKYLFVLTPVGDEVTSSNTIKAQEGTKLILEKRFKAICFFISTEGDL